MNIQFETDSLTSRSAQGLILLLQSLFPALNNSQPVNYPIPASEEQAIFGVPIQATPADAPKQSESAGIALVPDTTAGPGPAAPAEPTTRKRRTKAEIAAATGAADADEAQAKAQAQAQASPGDPAAANEAQSTSAPGTGLASPPKSVSKEEINGLFNSYIQRNSFEDAVAVLDAFGCSRLSDVAALEPLKLKDLVARLSKDNLSVTPKPAVEIVAHLIDEAQIRAAINSHMAAHTEKKTAAIVYSFGCKTVAEAMAMGQTKLAELVDKLNG